MPLIPYPNIPNVPGVPLIPRSSNFPPVPVQAILGLVQGFLWQSIASIQQWGIFNENGTSIFNANQFQENFFNNTIVSTNAVDYSKETIVSDFPVELGGFASYNKVEKPGMPVVTFAMSGTESDRAAFLETIDNACRSTDLYSVVTPSVTYINYSMDRYNYQRRSSRGATLLVVEISLKEVRQVSAQFTQIQIKDPKNVGAVPQVDSGKVQAQQPSKSTLKKLSDTFGLTP